MRRTIKGKFGSVVYIASDRMKLGGKTVSRYYKYLYSLKTKDGKMKKGLLWINDSSIIFSNSALQPLNFVLKIKKKGKSIEEYLETLVGTGAVFNKYFDFMKTKNEMVEISGDILMEEGSPERMEPSLTTQKLMVYGSVASGLVAMLSLVFLIRYYRVVFSKMKVEAEANHAEEELNRILYKNQSLDSKVFTHYHELIQTIKQTLTTKRIGAIIGGPPGTGKTYTIRKVLYDMHMKYGRDYFIAKGSSIDMVALYSNLYKYRNKLLILDDFDAPLLNENVVNVLKSATDTYPIRLITIMQGGKVGSSTDQSSYDFPSKFRYDGKIIVVTNLPESRVDTALKSRLGGYISVDFNTKEMYDIISGMLKTLYPNVSMEVKKEVLAYLMEVVEKNPNKKLSIRMYINALDIRLAYPNGWKRMILKSI